ncbi:sigma-54-dependent Fis family transcriptional regulator [Alloacidobacterium dinghuense]|uniref:Sigma-54-dependent Fis family transcriptional regulator n=1 Tax=Alloacidobacterium dinghuense TaxID=2763107 RepID=A0A7G8BLQ5_9BACT|nr:sigma-54 dependent transcriptional regulator [Alloacidobacterium dinghuense]QNI33475.1 sigma-54-dependent Fis family transcriptional regulator [Alloacidobacterium dinghuense]
MTQKSIETARLFVVSHDSAVLRPIWLIGESNDWQFESSSNAWEAIERVQSGVTPDLLLLDLPPEDDDGLHILRWLRRLRPALPIILIGHQPDLGRKQEAIRMGARDYLARPLDERHLEAVIGQYLSQACEVSEAEISSDDVEQVNEENFFIGVSPIMRRLRAQAVLLAEANVPVLILGESGSGKETTARLLHKLSVRSGFEFAKVNCAALPSDLLERELFGYRRDGAAAGAKSGKLEHCARGTILLDEITEMSMDLQANLLQTLQNKRFVRPGTSNFVEVDVRILAASSTNMEQALSENRLREDLYYRLSAYTIHVPPLRQRKEELPLLSRHFMHQLAKHYGLSPRSFSPAIIEACRSYSWPGNLRELENFVKRYLMVGDRELTFEKNHSDANEVNQNISFSAPRRLKLVPAAITPSRSAATASDSLKSLVESVKLEAERNAIAAALEKTGWNRKAAARLLKVSYRTLLYKIEHYQMRSPDASVFPGGNGLRSKGAGFRGNGQTD